MEDEYPTTGESVPKSQGSGFSYLAMLLYTQNRPEVRRTPKECTKKCEHPIVIDEQYVELASKAVNWLGFHFEPNHSIWTRFVKRPALG